jgi:hypothetical protein
LTTPCPPPPAPNLQFKGKGMFHEGNHGPAFLPKEAQPAHLGHVLATQKDRDEEEHEFSGVNPALNINSAPRQPV